jgi:ergothioneine biosynthesis protein EgtB
MTTLLDRYRSVRATTDGLVQPLAPEEFRIQSMPDVSPPWWMLGHTSWFFARNLLRDAGLQTPQDRDYDYLLNSYYARLGPRLPRGDRGKVTSPSTDEIRRYRRSVDERVASIGSDPSIAGVLTVGINHEQQHQELFVTEIKHIRFQNPPHLRTPYTHGSAASGPSRPGSTPAVTFIPVEGGLHEFGNVEGGWCWDNELGVHKAWAEPFEIMDRLVTNREYLEFIADGGYESSLLWLSNGFDAAQQERWRAPLYWELVDGAWQQWTLPGMKEVDPDEPVCHVSFYEAAAFARWKAESESAFRKVKLPTEREWELAARALTPKRSTMLDEGAFHPRVAPGDPGIQQMIGEVWEWTTSHYEAYPRFRPFPGGLGEYNDKFMDNQRVLRGGSVATPADHIRVSYRNFWHPATRFQFTGIRLIRSEALAG